MRISVFGLGTAALLALAAGAAPALAQPPHIIVRGATPLIVPPPYVYDGNSVYDWSDPAGLAGNPYARYYDPSGKIPDTRYYGPPAVDLVLARTLDRRHESILGHILKCQARYPSYSAASNYYTGPNGVPTVCYR